eukprot:4590018-Pleurochrysis_carterae.AAC.3
MTNSESVVDNGNVVRLLSSWHRGSQSKWAAVSCGKQHLEGAESSGSLDSIECWLVTLDCKLQLRRRTCARVVSSRCRRTQERARVYVLVRALR